MTNTEFISFIDEQIHQEMLFGQNKNYLIGLRNIKSDFNYIASKDFKIDTIDIIKRLYKEREENRIEYQNLGKTDLWLQEHIEAEILKNWLPKEPDKNEIFVFLECLTDIPKQKKSFKKYQDACIEHFGQKIDSSIILEFINGN